MPTKKNSVSKVWWKKTFQVGVLLAGVSLAVFFSLVSMALFADRLQHTPLLQPLRGFIQNITPYTRTLPSTPSSVNTTEIVQVVDELRAEQNLATLSAHITLEKYARLLTLEIEDQQSLALNNSQDILLSITSQPPQKVEILSLFAPQGMFSGKEELNEETVLLRDDLSFIGIATRTATLHSVPGTIITIALSSTFPENQEPTFTSTNTPEQTTTTRPTFTGEDLWKAVQDYRRAHNLPEFALSTELCTVASIRLNEQLELGRLDNHDGFDARANEFFEQHPGWTNINENLAAGYQTATQTVEWGWDQSLGHKALIQSRDYPKACAAANAGFAVLITGK